MSRSALLDETKAAVWNLGVTGYCDKLRLQPTVADLLDAAKPATAGRGDFLIQSALKAALIGDILTGHFRRVHDTLETLLGLHDTDVATRPNRSGSGR